MPERDRGDEDPYREPGRQRDPDGRIRDEPLIDVDGREEKTRPRRAEGGRRKARGSSTGPGDKPSAGLYGSDTGANMARAAVAETVGTFILIYTGTAVAVAAVLARPAIGPPFDSLAVPLAFGLVLVALVAAVGHVSGAHLNPAITLSLAATGKFPWNHVPAYLAAQLAGAVLAAFATWITLGGAARSDAALAAPTLAPGVGVLQGFVVEALITFILVFVVISVATDERVPAPVAPVAVGFALAAGVFVGGPVTGGSVNPARALGPIIVAWERTEKLENEWAACTGRRPVPRKARSGPRVSLLERCSSTSWLCSTVMGESRRSTAHSNHFSELLESYDRTSGRLRRELQSTPFRMPVRGGLVHERRWDQEHLKPVA